ncbi:glutamine-hydrolyzing carbamoyl-phosphate synthase small subunit [Salipaludibacillus agaradhaerens]|uniref:Carbamoyl phosphate synthase small chain n=1 Tax=Salipaludibacillus agaradhaerens TaxID=76935 RepID=A0A9Q4FW35_SALAG|nr:glutamine-hydrolyzing carbamoyl-phosphate synthase small subunit [Salipaludibacillus agaradhaerens]MCR6095970.1 glutamine-hydrolyzing carbamoyl-phosphate synthase small subunit [Salipaludibacillus agaradhaerens]MCR6114471.1 glutamine-hydrolyzing carbamoyl-phosphate synthase small subunit [Salipaludibacillus agaradhaerens]
MKRQLILENGATFIGEGIGSEEEKSGEVVFNTGMTGYQEILSDPSYCGQIVTLTYPLIGNYGINRDDFESVKPSIHGLVVREATDYPSHFRSQISIDQWLKKEKIPGIQGIDTRKLTRMIRENGTLKGRLCSMAADISQTVEELKATPLAVNQVSQVSTKNQYMNPGTKERIVLVDYGAKKGIVKDLVADGYEVVVVPYNIAAASLLSLQPDGVVLSNGPGDPTSVPEAIEMVKQLLGKVPMFGICLGHQLLALASGAKTEKMAFGHRGSNHPVKDLRTGQITITSQNHGYTVDTESIKHTDLIVTHINVNDKTIEGLSHKNYPAFSVQYHPEASPGPEDAKGLFKEFKTLVMQQKTANRGKTYA